jgi:hypothetical protein
MHKISRQRSVKYVLYIKPGKNYDKEDKNRSSKSDRTRVMGKNKSEQLI